MRHQVYVEKLPREHTRRERTTFGRTQMVETHRAHSQTPMSTQPHYETPLPHPPRYSTHPTACHAGDAGGMQPPRVDRSGCLNGRGPGGNLVPGGGLSHSEFVGVDLSLVK